MLTDIFLRAALLLGGAWLVNTFLLRRRSAAERHLVWLFAVAALLVLPALRPLSPRWEAPEPVTRTARTVITVTAGGDRQTNNSTQRPSIWASPAPYLAIWGLGMLALLARLVMAQRAAARLVETSVEFIGETTRISKQVGVPMVCGVTNPVILLPESARTWDREQLDSVLAHERMHIRRRDNLAQVVSQIACAVYWPQPLVWIAAKAMRMECEHASDDGVLANGKTSAADYAGALVNIARGLKGPAAAPAGGIAMTRTTQLHRRIAALLNPATDRRPAGNRFRAAAGAFALALVIGAAGIDSAAFAQGGGAFRGVVRDASGAAVPKARIDLRTPGADGGVREVLYTNEAGEFSLAKLPDGVYDLSVAKPGFALLTQSNFSFESSAARPFELTLQVGKIRETMAVSASPVAAVPQSPGAPKRIRVGGNVQAAKVVYKVPPVYPVGAKQDRVEGTVVLRAVIGIDGSVTQLEALNKSVDPRLTEAALNAVRTWRYSPTLLNGAPIEVVTEIDINFTLLP